MGFLQRLFRYFSTSSKMRIEAAMDPEVEIEQAISDAQRRDQDLRTQAAKVVAHRAMLERQIENTTTEVAKARELAKQALLRVEEMTKRGNTAEAERWQRTAQSIAMRLQAVEQNLASLQEQYAFAVDQADEAKRAVQMNATRLQELAARRLQLVGKLEQARMRETVNRAVQGMTATLGEPAPSLDDVQRKIEMRLSEAEASAELRAATPEGAEAELREVISLAQADDRLAELRRELGIAEPPLQLEPSRESQPSTADRAI